MTKILLDQETSVRNGVCHVIENPVINEEWLSLVIYFNSVISLLGPKNQFSENLIKIEEFPISDLTKLQVTDAPLTDMFEAKLRIILYCFQNDIIYYDAIDKEERENLINIIGKNINDSVSFLKESFLTVDILKLIILNQLPQISGPLPEKLIDALIKYKKSEHHINLVKGIKLQTQKYKGYFFLTNDIKSNIKATLIENQAVILDLLDFKKITSFDFKSILSDGASGVSSLIIPFLPLGTIQEIYNFFKNNKKIKSNDEILFTLSVMYLQKLLAENLENNQNTQCGICKMTSFEIDNLNDEDVDNHISEVSSNMCNDHRIKYLQLRKFHQLMGKPLLFEMIK